jgi:hypothetical protein
MASGQYVILGYIRMGLSCIFSLVGVGAGVFLLIRKKTFPGILAIVGFLLLGLETISGFVIYPVLMGSMVNSFKMDILLASNLLGCFTGLLNILGMGAIIVALVMGALPKSKTAE